MGWIKLDRAIMDNFLWKDKPFSKGQAWVDLLLLANHKEHKMIYKDEVIICHRGEVNRSLTWLADRWGWSRQRVRRFLDALESDGMCSLNVTTNRTAITIENYEKYQGVCTTNVTTSGQRMDNEWTTSGHIQEGKEGKKRKEKADDRSDEGSVTANSREARLAEMQRQDEEEKARLNRLAKERSNNEQRTAYRKINKRS